MRKTREDRIRTGAIAWLELLEIDPGSARDLLADWNPETLKQIGTGAMSFAKKGGRFVEVMQTLAGIETRLKRLRDGLGISRKAPSGILPRATVVFKDEGKWISPGDWIPDILDRAAAFDPIHSTHKGERSVSEKDLIAARLDHILVLGSDTLYVEGVAVHHSLRRDLWLTPGPSVFDAVFEIARIIHGFDC